MQEFLTVQQVADILQVHHRTIRRWIGLGKLPSLSLNLGIKGLIRIPRDEFDEWLEEHKQGIRKGEIVYDSLGRFRSVSDGDRRRVRGSRSGRKGGML